MKKVPKAQIQQLQKEVRTQNRLLIVACIAVLLLCIGLYFGMSAVKQSVAPQYWSYHAAAEEVLSGKETPNQYEYNGIIFARENETSLWQFQIIIKKQVYDISAHYAPKDVENISLHDFAVLGIVYKPIIVTTLNSQLDDVEGAAASAAIGAIELGKIIGTKNGILNKTTGSTVTGYKINNTYTGVTCANATSRVGIIQIELAEKTRVLAKNSCAIVQGTNPQEIIRASDRLMYAILAIIPLERQKEKVSASKQLEDILTNQTQEPNTTIAE